MEIRQWQSTVASLNRSFQEFGFKLQIGKNAVAYNLFLLLPPFFIFGVLIYLNGEIPAVVPQEEASLRAHLSWEFDCLHGLVKLH